MKLIADSGSTKADWCLTKGNGRSIDFKTPGYNPFYITTDEIVQSLTGKLPENIRKEAVTEIWFYGSGCTPEKAFIVADALKQVFPAAAIQVKSDMLGAARALLGTQSGFAAILGTGTNSCLYNGKEISYSVSSLGYILGDEGSGSYIGKRLLTQYMRGKLPQELRHKFEETYTDTPAEIMEKVYRQSFPNRYCAGFSKFLGENSGHPYCSQLVKTAFNDFFENLVSAYADYQSYTFNCAGSVGWYFKDILAETAAEFGMECGRILKSPIEGLVNYHSGIND